MSCTGGIPLLELLIDAEDGDTPEAIKAAWTEALHTRQVEAAWCEAGTPGDGLRLSCGEHGDLLVQSDDESLLQLAPLIKRRLDRSAALHLALERFQLTNNGGRIGVWDWRIASDTFYFNENIPSFLGLDLPAGDHPPALVMAAVQARIPAAEEAPLRELWLALKEGARDRFSFEQRVELPEGHQAWLHIQGRAIYTAGVLTRILGTCVDETQSHIDRERLASSLMAKETLLQELHHRVKNNLQIVSSLLYLQLSRTQHDEARLALRESRNRILAMAAIHRRLLESSLSAKVKAGPYLEQICGHLLQSYGMRGRVKLEVNAIDLTLTREQALPCGLIVNELVSNAFKYAFRDGRGGHVWVSLEAQDRMLELRVCDDGLGLPKALKIQELDSLGLQLVSSLAEQLKGSVESRARDSHGSCFIIPFPR